MDVKICIDRFTQLVLKSVTLDVLNDLQWGLIITKDEKKAIVFAYSEPYA